MAHGPLNTISALGKGEYRITFPHPIKFDMNFLDFSRGQKIRVISQHPNSRFAIAVEGEKGALLAWLRTVGGETEDALKRYEDFMTD